MMTKQIVEGYFAKHKMVAVLVCVFQVLMMVFTYRNLADTQRIIKEAAIQANWQITVAKNGDSMIAKNGDSKIAKHGDSIEYKNEEKPGDVVPSSRVPVPASRSKASRSKRALDSGSMIIVQIDESDNKHLTLKSNKKKSKTKICIGGGYTSNKGPDITALNMHSRLNIFRIFIPTFCRTASPGYQYHFYFGIDVSDLLISHSDMYKAFLNTFSRVIKQHCTKLDVNPMIKVVPCNYTGRPSWSFNDAFYQAYLDGMDYFYHVNDDTNFLLRGWTQDLINTLKKYKPPNIGVVGPHTKGGTSNLLTYHMVHRKHFDIFGYLYPRIFSTWWSDDWLTNVYNPGRAIQLEAVHLHHTNSKGHRYDVVYTDQKYLKFETDKGKKILERYLSQTIGVKNESSHSQYIISMALYANNPAYTAGVIRNAQLVSVIYPGWTLRVYMASPSEPNSTYNSSRTSGPSIKQNINMGIINTLVSLGTQVVFVKNNDISPKYWNYLVADDETVEYFLIRNVDTRLSEREADAVSDWLKFRSTLSHNGQQKGFIQSMFYSSSETSADFHCIRDHSQYSSHSVVDGLWGAHRRSFLKAIASDMTSILKNKMDYDVDLLEKYIWKQVESSSYCHDSVSCSQWPNVHRFSRPKVGIEYLGQKFDMNGQYTDLQFIGVL